MLEGLLSWSNVHLAGVFAAATGGEAVALEGWGGNPRYGIYETADGWMAVSAHTDVTWTGLATAAGKPEWLEDPRFATVEAREVNKPARLELTQSVLITDTTASWMERLTAHDVPCAPVLTRAQVWQHPQVRANGAVIESDHATTEPAPEPRPGPTGIPWALAHWMKSATIRK